MKKLLIIPFLALSLSGCAGFTQFVQTAETTLSLTTKSVQNPVTKNDLYAIETTTNGAFKLLNQYRAACIAGNADVNCKDNIRKIQAYTRLLPPYVSQLRTFVKSNDQINASVVYNELIAVYAKAKTTATQLGVNIGGQ
jgi:hypothetical protein